VLNKNDGRRGGFELKYLVRTQLKRGTMSNDIQIVKIIRNAVSETKSTGKIEEEAETVECMFEFKAFVFVGC
jgi:hypothetical protein